MICKIRQTFPLYGMQLVIAFIIIIAYYFLVLMGYSKIERIFTLNAMFVVLKASFSNLEAIVLLFQATHNARSYKV